MTIEGIDADKDGIRDDVEREIGLYYPENPTARAYSYILASRLQHIIEKPLDKNTYIQSIKDMSFAESCLDGITVSQEYKGIVFVLPLVRNTYNRSLAYIDARGLIGGELIPDMLTCY